MNTRAFQYILLVAALVLPVSVFAQVGFGSYVAPNQAAPIQGASMVGDGGTFGGAAASVQAPLSPAVGSPTFGGMIGSSPAPALQAVPNAALQMLGGGSFGAGVSVSDVPPTQTTPVYSAPISSWFSSMLNASFSNGVSSNPSGAPVAPTNISAILSGMACAQDAAFCTNRTAADSECGSDCAGHTGVIGGQSPSVYTPIAPPASQTIAPVPCVATAIKCADGTVILPGPDCTYHFTCAMDVADRAPNTVRTEVPLVRGGDVMDSTTYFAGTENNTFAAAPQQGVAIGQTFESRTGTFIQGMLGIGGWIGRFFR